MKIHWFSKNSSSLLPRDNLTHPKLSTVHCTINNSKILIPWTYPIRSNSCALLTYERCIWHPAFSSKVVPTIHRQALIYPSFYLNFHVFCSEELSFLFPPLTVPGRSPRSTPHVHPFAVQQQSPRSIQFYCSYSRSLIFWASIEASALVEYLTVRK